MIANASTMGSLEDRVYARLTEENPKKKMKVSDAERKAILERIATEGGIKSDTLREDVAKLFDKDADILDDLADRQARSYLMNEILQKPSPAMETIVKDVAVRQRKVLNDFTDSASTMKNETIAYGTGQVRAKQQAKETVYRAQSDEEAERIRRSLQQGPEYGSKI